VACAATTPDSSDKAIVQQGPNPDSDLSSAVVTEDFIGLDSCLLVL
jgi:hypothetical protein